MVITVGARSQRVDKHGLAGAGLYLGGRMLRTASERHGACESAKPILHERNEHCKRVTLIAKRGLEKRGFGFPVDFWRVPGWPPGGLRAGNANGGVIPTPTRVVACADLACAPRGTDSLVALFPDGLLATTPLGLTPRREIPG